jgi:hypothetical protein
MNSPSCKSSTAKKRTKGEQIYTCTKLYLSYPMPRQLLFLYHLVHPRRNAHVASLLQSQRTSPPIKDTFLLRIHAHHNPMTGLNSSDNHSNISTQSSDVMEHVTFLSAKRAIWQRPPGKSRQKMFVATDLNLLALLPLLTSLMTDLNTLAIASKKAAEAPTLYRRTSQFCPVMF